MHGVVVTASIDPARVEEATAFLRSTIVPIVKQAPGVVSGYWLSPQDGHALAIVLFESEEAAQGAAATIPNAPRLDFVNIDSIEVREIIASI